MCFWSMTTPEGNDRFNPGQTVRKGLSALPGNSSVDWLGLAQKAAGLRPATVRWWERFLQRVWNDSECSGVES